MKSSFENNFSSLLRENQYVIYYIIKKYPIDASYHDDIFQDISLKAWKSYSDFRNESTFSTWICTITRYTVIDKLRRIRDQQNRLRRYIDFYEATDSHIDTPYAEQSLPPIDSLSEIEKKTLQLRLSGLSFKKISAITGEPVNRLITRMHRIKHRLSKSINT